MNLFRGKLLSDFFVFLAPIRSHPVLLVFLLTALIVFPALAGLVTPLFPLYYKSSSFLELQCSPVFTGHLTKHPNVCNSSLITKQPDSPGGGGTAGRAHRAALLLVRALQG